MNIKKIAIIGVVTLGSLSTTVFADVLNGSFEEDGANPPLSGSFNTLFPGNTDINDWEVISGNIDWINGYWQASDGRKSIDMNGCTAGTIHQKISTKPGYYYWVTFDLAGNPDGFPPRIKELKVEAAEDSGIFRFDTTGKTRTNMGWLPQLFKFQATDIETTLQFTSQNTSCGGPALDNVHVAEYVPTTKDECKEDGWQAFGIFKNQGDCVSFVATNGKNPPNGVNP